MDYAGTFLPVNAPSPDSSGGFVELLVNRSRIQDIAETGRNNDIFALFYNVCGVVPPVNNIGYHENNSFKDDWGGLRHSHVIFRGLKRPFHEQNHDSNVYIYVTCPRFVYRFVTDNMVCPAKRVDSPPNSVFVSYVVFKEDSFKVGEIKSWEWIVADKNNSRFPADYSSRYEEKVWENG